MNQSSTINELAAALHLAQGKIKHAIKDSANPFYKSKFADLTSVWDAIRDAFQAHGLSVSQLPDQDDDGKPVLVTILMHKSGQWISGSYPITPIKNDPQGVGSAITYARRYALQAVAGVCADDDDGEAAHGRIAKVDVATGEPKRAQTKLSDNDRAAIGIYGGMIESALGLEGVKAYTEVKKGLAYSSRETILAGVQAFAKDNGVELDDAQWATFKSLWGKA
jgi:hypothetical protein